MPKIRKKLKSHFWEKRRTDGRTDGRMDEQKDRQTVILWDPPKDGGPEIGFLI